MVYRLCIHYIVPLSIAFAIGVYCGARVFSKNTVQIKTVTVTKTKFIAYPKTPEAYKHCALSPIRITATSQDDTVHVVARDACKQAEADITIEQKPTLWYWVAIGALGCALIVAL